MLQNAATVTISVDSLRHLDKMASRVQRLLGDTDDELACRMAAMRIALELEA